MLHDDKQAEERRAALLTAALSEQWEHVNQAVEANPAVAFVADSGMQDAIRSVINGATITYRWALPTQVGIKLVDPDLDARCCQSKRGGAGAHNARSVCAEAVVPFFLPLSNVLGGKSDDPYVSNPLRVPEITEAYRADRGDKVGWDLLCGILAFVEEAGQYEVTLGVFRQTLLEIRRRLETTQVTYPAPLRLPLGSTSQLIEEFIGERSGGVRVQAVGSALFQTLGQRYGFTVLVSAPNAADAAGRRVADVECQYEEGQTFLAVELKDRQLRMTEAQTTVTTAREQEVREILFIAQNGVAPDDALRMSELIDSEYVKGQNIYLCEDILDFASSLLLMLGEEGRKDLLDRIGRYLDEYADYADRRRFSDLLRLA